MDSLTQIALGSAVAALTAPSRHRRAALIAGGVLGTLPDLDVIPLTLFGADAVCLLTWHRGPSHSLLVLTMLGWLLWLVLCRWWAPVKEAPARWLWAIELALLTHPLLDAFTVYGTQLFWPLPSSPVMGQHIYHVFRYAEAVGGEAGARSPPNNSIGPRSIASAWLESGGEFGRSRLGHKFDQQASIPRSVAKGEWKYDYD